MVDLYKFIQTMTSAVRKGTYSMGFIVDHKKTLIKHQSSTEHKGNYSFVKII